jgi:Rrf2 family transcriptional regulator, cysteine metabolism repressor
MRLTTRSEYALLALIHLARQASSEFVSTEAIARAQRIPLAYLEQILRALKRARIVQSSKGQHGGYRLARPASEITIAEIVRQLDGALAPTQSVSEQFYQPTPIEKESKMLALLRSIRVTIAEKLETTSIAEVI